MDEVDVEVLLDVDVLVELEEVLLEVDVVLDELLEEAAVAR